MDEEDSIIRLVKAVEKYPVIYDFSLLGHANKDEVNKAWYEVSQITNLSVDACKEKWRNCRNCWARDLRCNAVSGYSNRKKKPYYLAEYLSFLTPFTKLRPPKTVEMNSDSSALPSSIALLKDEDVGQEDDENPNQDSEKCSYEREKITSHQEKGNEKKRTADDVETVFMSYLEMKRKKYSSEQDNPDMLFFRSIIPEMATLSPSQKISFKICILQTLNNMLLNSSNS